MKTRIKELNGYDVEISTSKNYRGILSCSAQFGTMEAGNGYTSFSFAMFTDPNITLATAAPGTRATEKNIKEVHAAGLAKFEELKAAGELPKREAAEEVEPGQIIFLNHSYGGRTRLAVYEKLSRDSFKVVDLDTLELLTAEHVRPAEKIFGIGFYYQKGNTVPMEEVSAAVEAATEKAQKAAEARERAEEEANAEKAAKIAAGREILPAIPAGCTHIIAAHQRRDDSDPMTDYFNSSTVQTVFLAWSRHGRNLFDEMRKAAAISPDPEINCYSVKGEGKDEHREDYSGGHGYYLGESKYHGWIIEKHTVNGYGASLEALQIAAAEGRFLATEAPEEEAGTVAPVETEAGTINIISYSDKAIAVIGDTKPMKDKLKAIGGRFNFRLSCGAGWIFPKTKLQDVIKAVEDYTGQSKLNEIKGQIKEEVKKIEAIDPAAGMIEAQEDAYFDNFCQSNGI